MYNGLMNVLKRTIPIAVMSVLVGCGDKPAPEVHTQQPPAPLRINAKAGPWDVGEGSGRELVSKHYRIYTTSRRPEMLDYLPGFMEAAHRNYLDVTGLPARPAAEPMPVYMMGTRQEWASLTKSVVGRQWNIYSSISAGGYCYKGVCVFWDIGGITSMSVASHEGLHQFLHHRDMQHLPMWMEEGLATLCEGYHIEGSTVQFTPHRNVARFSDLRKILVNDWWIPLEKLLPMDGGDAVKLGATERTVGYYGQIWALAVFLRTDAAYRAGRDRLIADAEAGRLTDALDPGDRAIVRQLGGTRSYNKQIALPLFKRYISDDLPAFERRYKAFAKKLVMLN